MNLFDLLKKRDNKEVEFAPLQRVEGANSAGLMPDGTPARNVNQGNPLEIVQFNEQGGLMQPQAQQQPTEEKIGIGQKLYEALLGKTAQSTDDVNSDAMSATISENPRTGGILRDMREGYNENRNNPLNLDNFGQKSLIDGRPKNLATRIGEGLGSLARFAESPLGRGLLVGGAIGLTGGNPLQIMTFGSSTGFQNQANRMRDRAYRDDLISIAQQSLKNQAGFDELSPEEQDARLNAVVNNINSYRGYLNDSTYNNMMQAQQLRDNAAYRKMYFDTQQENLEAQREWQRQQAEYQRKLDERNYQLQLNKLASDNADRAANREIQRGQLGLGYAKLEQDRQNTLAKNAGNKEDFSDIENQLKAFENSFKSVNNPLRYRAFGWGSERLNTLSKEEANFNAQRTLLFNQIARKLGGEKGVLSDADIKRVEAALPSLGDTYKQKQAKMQAIYQLLDIKKGGNSGNYSVGKYKVRMK